ncbi:MAG: hypothetical protein GVY36_01465 [Verrucomicrobia bacterium]|jgi:hypothetical protein|nr:hypothetical protein [Verrucomicrobiota bacterium]
MKKIVSTFSCVAVLASSSLFGQVTTDPVGYVSKSLSAGGYTLGPTFVKSATFQGPVIGVNSDWIDVGTALTLDEPHYLMPLSGVSDGYAVTIVEVNGTQVRLEQTLSIAEGDTVAIHPHFLIKDLGEDLPNGFAVALYNSDGSVTEASYQDNFLGKGWIGEAETPVFPGEGFVVNSPAAFELLFSGSVNTKTVKYSLSGGVTNIVAGLAPMSQTALLLEDLAPGTGIADYAQGGNFNNPTEISRGPAFLGGNWSGDLSTVEIGSGFATVVVPSENSIVDLPTQLSSN